MLAHDMFNARSTTVEIDCADDVTGIERIMLAAHGDLQRLLSAFFGNPISVHCVYANTSPRSLPASVEHVITQTRQVHLICASRIVCVATSTVYLSSAESERLLLDEKYPIGQVYRQLGATPKFTLLNVDTKVVDGTRLLSRTYTLESKGMFCHILEEFPDRDMFAQGAKWFEVVPNVKQHSIASTEALELPVTTKDFFSVAPHNLDAKPTLSAILEAQAADPAISQKVFAAYPRPSNGTAEEYDEITYAQFARLVEYEASVWYNRLSPLLSLQTSRRSAAPVIAVLGDSGFYYAVIVMALIRLNATVFPISTANSEAALAHLLETCQVQVLVHGSAYSSVAQAAVSKYNVPTVALDRVLKNHELDALSIPPPPIGMKSRMLFHHTYPDIPIIVHSSGSTAFPKPVRWTPTSFLSNCQVMLTKGSWSAFANPNNRFLCLGPLVHTMGLTLGLGATICAGTTIVFPLTHSWPPSPSDIMRSFRATKVSTCIIVPLLLEQLVNALDNLQPLVSLDVLLTGGAHCPEKLATRLVSSGVNLRSVYGSSETGHLMVGSHTRSPNSQVSSWNLMRPFPHTRLVLSPIRDPEMLGELASYQVQMAVEDVRLASGILKLDELTWNTGDVVEEVPPGSGWYRLLYRADDILVHDSGEKTNPLPMEMHCLSSDLIECVAIIGHQKPLTAAIVQLNRDEALRYNEPERVAMVREVIRGANAVAPKHSRVIEEMIFILPLDSTKHIPRTPKGNCIRPKVIQAFSNEIDALYKEVLVDMSDDGFSRSSPSSDVTLTDVQDQVAKILQGVTEKEASKISSTKSLFDDGLDSVTAVRFANKLSKAFGMKLSSQFVYQNSSLSQISLALHNRVSPRTATPTSISSRAELLHEIFERQRNVLYSSQSIVLASRSTFSPKLTSEKQVVAIVGAAGSLGIWQVKAALDRSDVEKIVCLIRGPSLRTAYDKLISGLRKANFDDLVHQVIAWRDYHLAHPEMVAMELHQRLVVLPFDLASPLFHPDDFISLAKSVTTIVHTGWKMDFNQVVQDFERDCLAGTTQLLLLTAYIRPKQFYFISSIGTVLDSNESVVRETLSPWTNEESITASPHGYSESKFICEHLIREAATLLDIPCSVARVGQITGDTVSGVWKTQEMNPIIIAGSSRVGKFPIPEGAALDWIPVDVVGASTIELALQRSKLGEVTVHHLVNPHPSTYAALADMLNALGVKVAPVSPQEWWSAIEVDKENPCLAIQGYIEETIVRPLAHRPEVFRAPPTLDINLTSKISPSLAKCPPLDQGLWSRYLMYWSKLGFIAK